MNIEIDWHIERSAFAHRVYACVANMSKEAQKSINTVTIKRSGNRDSRNKDEMSIIFHATKGTWLSGEVVFGFIEALGKAGIYLFERENDENFTNLCLYVLCPEIGFRDQDKWDDMEHQLSMLKYARDSEDAGDTEQANAYYNELDKLLPRHPQPKVETANVATEG